MLAADYWLDGPGIESQWGRDFSHTSRPALVFFLFCLFHPSHLTVSSGVVMSFETVKYATAMSHVFNRLLWLQR
jgi:hypothetical protein